MSPAPDYVPFPVFMPPEASGRPRPRVFVSPARYVQGPGVIDDLGRHLGILPARRAALLMSERGHRSEGRRIADSLRAAGIGCEARVFGGECSIEEIDGHAKGLASAGVDAVVGAGGGKCVDAAKAIAHRLGVPAVIVPTLASNDAPCSAVSVIYSSEGVSTGVEFQPANPAFVVVDTGVVAAASERYLVAGMGDAMATWFEARVCLENPSAMTTLGARPTLASSAIGEVCARTLFDRGAAAAEAVREDRVDEALEAVVEANTLLSGLGFESGGLAAAHGVAQSLTAVPVVHAHHLHGEMVAIGTLVQLVLEEKLEEAERVADFFASVGLPVRLEQISLAADDARALDTIVEGTLAFPFIGNLPKPVSAETIRKAVVGADRLGRTVARRSGDAAWRRVQGQAP
jgi:glycerol dehydrogenase